MKKETKSIFIYILILFVIPVMFVCSSGKINTSEIQIVTDSPVFPSFDLPCPKSDTEKNYLGLTGTEKFKIADIKSEVLIVEIFSFYCPHCQKSAPMVNKIYNSIEEQNNLKNRIKIIGIGAGNSAYEVNAFRDKYNIPFSMFPDEDESISTAMGTRVTPTFIGLKLDAGEYKKYFYLEGEFENSQNFLNDIIKLAGIKGGEK